MLNNSDNEAMQILADSMAEYMWSKHFAQKMNDVVRFYRAEVTETANNGLIGIKKPFDANTFYIPYVTSAASLAVGDQCTVLVFGGQSNAFIIGDGTLSNL